MRTLVAIGLAAGMLAAGCGDDGEDTDAPQQPEAGSLVFRSEAVGFTFQYPEGFRAQTQPSDQILGQVSLEKGSALNAIKVRKTSDQELGPDRYLDEFQSDFERTVGSVDKREERIGDLDVGVLEFEDSVSELGRRVQFVSRSYFFSGAGRTWQLECIADDEHREQIDAACGQALESIAFET